MKIVKGLIKAVFFIFLAIFFGAYGIQYFAKQTRERSEQESLSKISFSDIAIAKFSILPGQSAHSSINGMSYNTATGREYISYFTMSGRAINKSPRYILQVIGFEVTAQECEPNAGCVIIGVQEISTTPIIPPGQARDFEETIQLTGIQNAQNVQWSYRVKYLMGE